MRLRALGLGACFGAMLLLPAARPAAAASSIAYTAAGSEPVAPGVRHEWLGGGEQRPSRSPAGGG